MIAEFYGLPGSGKTTHMKLLKENFPDKVEIIILKKNIFTSSNVKNIFSREFISFFFKMIKLWFAKKHKEKYDFKALYYFCSLYLDFMILRVRDDGKIYAVDHGLLQCVSSLVWDDRRLIEKSVPLLRHIVDHFGEYVDFVYLYGSDQSELYDRIINRKYMVRLKNYSREDAYRVLENQDILFKKAESLIREKHKTVSIDSTDDVMTNFDRICGYFNIKGE